MNGKCKREIFQTKKGVCMIMTEKIKFNRFQKWLELMSIAVLFFMFAFLVTNWSSIPETIPSHYNASGLVDGWGSKNSLLLFPGICLVMYALLTVVSFFPKTWNLPGKTTEENKARRYSAALSLMCMLKLEMLLTFTFITVSMVKMSPLGGLFMIFMLVGVFGPLVYYIIKIIKVSKRKD
jgi:uncharacterized membrane protein